MSNQEIICPTCGYYCLGRGGLGCIDKPTLTSETNKDSTGIEEDLEDLKGKISELEKEYTSYKIRSDDVLLSRGKSSGGTKFESEMSEEEILSKINLNISQKSD